MQKRKYSCEFSYLCNFKVTLVFITHGGFQEYYIDFWILQVCFTLYINLTLLPYIHYVYFTQSNLPIVLLFVTL